MRKVARVIASSIGETGGEGRGKAASSCKPFGVSCPAEASDAGVEGRLSERGVGESTQFEASTGESVAEPPISDDEVEVCRDFRA